MAALEIREKQIANNDHQTRAEWKEKFEKLLVRHVRGATVVGADAPRLWNTSSALMPEGGQQRWVTRLDKAGFAVSTGSACTTGKEEPSHVLSAMGYQAGQVTQVLRFSSGWETTAADWEALEKCVVQVLGEIHAPK
jgi:cysteine desulfurase